MPKPKQQFVTIEYEQVRYDKRLKELPSDTERWAWLKVMATCIALRRDTFERTEVTSPYLADKVGVTPELLRSTVEGCLDVGLMKLGPRGAVTVCDVRANHPKLRGWNENPERFDATPIKLPLRPREVQVQEEVQKESSPRPQQPGGQTPEKTIEEGDQPRGSTGPRRLTPDDVGFC